MQLKAYCLMASLEYPLNTDLIHDLMHGSLTMRWGGGRQQLGPRGRSSATLGGWMCKLEPQAWSSPGAHAG